MAKAGRRARVRAARTPRARNNRAFAQGYASGKKVLVKSLDPRLLKQSKSLILY